jgi:hypothetical protein
MKKQPRDANKPKPDPVKKSETVQLTPEELRAIAGGATYVPPKPTGGPMTTKKPTP